MSAVAEDGPLQDPAALASTARQLLVAAGMTSEMAEDVAAVLLEADLLGHRTHGLSMLPNYLERIERGATACKGDLEVLADGGASFAWRANRLPGAWVMRRAIREVLARVTSHPVITATIADCAHIGALQAYLKPITDEGLFVTLATTDPGLASVAPFGGAEPVLTSNPVAYGIPTLGDPILIDHSTSVVSNGSIAAYATRGERTPGPWLLDGQGHPSDDPACLGQEPPGTIALLGGPEFGYKGFGFSLMVEALSLGLSGHGRSTAPSRGGQGVFLQVIDPAAFAGREAFLRETTALAERCRASRPRAGGPPVRLPGERALANRARHLAEGLPYSRQVLDSITDWARRLGVEKGL
ncbi:Ldh family oxidoreductase [Roseomonas sp. SSH11]|uniref:Ldh family oxidoreductase n=1 Tax=Pararoseomonas baculiformis TaxID=2820812 RepID=A0ABS4ADG9_9PROT|nr:Ldh family oxidoreductase [Pararoseomonas baculiformis]MBP0445047.1 Ldh family oxidoreductase [Pararoseomonas baculiformis]